MTKSLGQQLKALRLKKGYTQEGLAACMLVSRQTILNWEKNNTIPDSENLFRLAEIYDVSVDVLLGRREPTCTTKTLKRYLFLLALLGVGSVIQFSGLLPIPILLFVFLLKYIGLEIYHIIKMR